MFLFQDHEGNFGNCCNGMEPMVVTLKERLCFSFLQEMRKF